jgi:hypothetical protein
MARFELGLLIEGVPAEVDSSVTKSPGNLDSPVMSFITEDSRTPTKELDKATPADLLEGGKTVGGRKGLSESRWLLEDGCQPWTRYPTTASMLRPFLISTAREAVELLLVTIGDKAKGIEESKRSLGTELVFEGHVGGNRSTGGVLGSEGGGTGDEGGNDNRLSF